MPNTFHLQVVTPERVMLNEQVLYVSAPGVEGYMGIMANHAPLMSSLLPGEVVGTQIDGRTTSHIVISGGFIEVSKTGVVILADSGVRADQIDLTRAEIDLAEAQKMIANLTPGSAEARQALTQANLAESKIRAAKNSGTGMR